MHRLYRIADDFEATIRILTEAEGGRMNPPFNGIRWDFAYASDKPAENLYMIHPDFYSQSGDSLPTDAPLPLGVDLPARMTIVIDEMREQVHRARKNLALSSIAMKGQRESLLGASPALQGCIIHAPVPPNSGVMCYGETTGE